MNNVKIVTVAGRYYAMDRDNRWERIELAYNALMLGDGVRMHTAEEAVDASYKQKFTTNSSCRPLSAIITA